MFSLLIKTGITVHYNFNERAELNRTNGNDSLESCRHVLRRQSEEARKAAERRQQIRLEAERHRLEAEEARRKAFEAERLRLLALEEEEHQKKLAEQVG